MLTACFCFPAYAQEYGKPDVEFLPESGQWVFARGKWEVTTWVRNEAGEMQQAERKAEVELWYLPDGLTVQSTFRLGNESFSTQLKTYDIESGKWITQFINSKRQRRATTESRWINGQMVTLNVSGYSGKDEFMSREVDGEISADRFVKTIRRSYDMGETWGPVVFRMVFDRVN